MEFLKKSPLFLKQHYEKVLLGLAFIALGVAIWLLNDKIQTERVKAEDFMKGILNRPMKPIVPLDLDRHKAALAAFYQPPALNFSVPHHLINPVKWQRRPDGSLLKIEKGTEVGPDALRVVKITPLYLIITLEKVAVPGYYMSVTKEAHTNRLMRAKSPLTYVKLGEKDRPSPSGTFLLKEVKGAPENPEELVIEILDTGLRGSVGKDKPFQRVDGFKVDLSYPPENRTFLEKRLGEMVTLGADNYIIVDMTPKEIVLSAISNGKRTTIR